MNIDDAGHKHGLDSTQYRNSARVADILLADYLQGWLDAGYQVLVTAGKDCGARGKVLRVLEDGVVTRIGGAKPHAVDVRVIAATNKNLEDEIGKGAFREDLFYRLNVVPIRVPPLRERTEDIGELVQHFFALAHSEGLPLKSVSADAMERLLTDGRTYGEIFASGTGYSPSTLTAAGGGPVLATEDLPGDPVRRQDLVPARGPRGMARDHSVLAVRRVHGRRAPAPAGVHRSGAAQGVAEQALDLAWRRAGRGAGGRGHHLVRAARHRAIRHPARRRHHRLHGLGARRGDRRPAGGDDRRPHRPPPAALSAP